MLSSNLLDFFIFINKIPTCNLYVTKENFTRSVFQKFSPPAPNSVLNVYTRVMKFLKLPLLKFTNNNDDVETSEGIYHFGLFFASCRFEHFVSTDNMFIHILPYF